MMVPTALGLAAALAGAGDVSGLPRAAFDPGPVPVIARIHVPPVAARAFSTIDDVLLGSVAVDAAEALRSRFAEPGSVATGSIRPAGPARIDAGLPKTGDSAVTRASTFVTERTDLPSYFFKDRVVAPHLSPDIEVGISERSSLGFYGEVVHQNREDVRNNTQRETRDLGAGISFQYKFNSR